MNADDKIPQDLESEMAVLGAMELHADAIDAVTDIIPSGCSEAFYLPQHRTIFSAICGLRAEETPADILTLESRLRETDKLESVGGRSYLITLAESVPSIANAEYYAGVVREKWRLRRMYSLGHRLQAGACECFADPEELARIAGQECMAMENPTAATGIRKVGDVAAEIIDRLEHGQPDIGIATGLPLLDNVMGGMRGGDLIILAAARSVGKTALAVQILSRAAFDDGLCVCLFSMEMPANQVTRRILSARTGVYGNKFNGQAPYTKYDSDALHACEIPDGWLIDDRGSVGPQEFRMRARQVKQRYGVSLIAVDYLQLCSRDGRRGGSTHDAIGDMSRTVKGTARELDIPIILLSQLSRAHLQQGRAPELYDLKESGDIENDADIVWLMHPKGQYGATNERPSEFRLHLRMAKHRNGELVSGTVDFNGPTQTFRDSTEDEQNESAAIAAREYAQ